MSETISITRKNKVHFHDDVSSFSLTPLAPERVGCDHISRNTRSSSSLCTVVCLCVSLSHLTNFYRGQMTILLKTYVNLKIEKWLHTKYDTMT